MVMLLLTAYLIQSSSVHISGTVPVLSWAVAAAADKTDAAHKARQVLENDFIFYYSVKEEQK